MTRAVKLVLIVLSSLQYMVGQVSPGGTAGAPFRMGFDARAIGMGNAVSAMPFADNPSVYNPALLPYVTSQNIHTGAAMLPLDRSLFHVAYSTPLPPTAGLSLSAMGARVGDIQGRDVNGVPTETYTTTEYAVALSFGLQPAPGFTFGATARLLHARLLPEMTSTTVGLDFGATYLVGSGVLIGAAIRDVNSKYRWDSTPIYGRNGNNSVDPFPKRFIISSSWSPDGLPLTIAAEAEGISGLFIFRAGAAYQLHPDVAIRAGADGLDPERRIGTRFTFGASIGNLGVFWNPSLDYAFMIEPLVSAGGHFLTIRFHMNE